MMGHGQFWLMYAGGTVLQTAKLIYMWIMWIVANAKDQRTTI
jgi:hypothetical protein